MFDDEDDDQGLYLLVLGVLTAILVVVAVIARSGGELRDATVTGPAPAEDAMADSAEEPAPTTTEAATTTDAPTTTTTAAPEAEVATMWDALTGSGLATQFAAIGGALGLQADLEALEDADGNVIDRTLFAPSDDAVAQLTPEAIGALVDDPAAAAALVGYHFIDERLTAEDLLALDGEVLTTRTGLPMAVSVEDGIVVLNGTTRVTAADFGADNGVIHIIDVILDPPTVNEVLGLESIEFEVASSNITAAGQEELLKAVAFFAENPGVNAVIEGHTDTDGEEDANLRLSQSRADAVLAFLVENGIDTDRLTAVGFGEQNPIVVDGVEDKAASRRIEFEVR